MIWMYGVTGPKLFASEADVPDGEGWVDSPAKVGPSQAVSDGPGLLKEMNRQQLKDYAETQGLGVDLRLGSERLRAAIIKAQTP